MSENEEKKPDENRSRLFGPRGEVLTQERQAVPPMYEGGFELPVPYEPTVENLLRGCAVPMEVAPGVTQPVAQIHPDVTLCWVETLRGFEERDTRIAELEDMLEAMATVIEDMRKQLGLPDTGPEDPKESKE